MREKETLQTNDAADSVTSQALQKTGAYALLEIYQKQSKKQPRMQDFHMYNKSKQNERKVKQ